VYKTALQSLQWLRPIVFETTITEQLYGKEYMFHFLCIAVYMI